MEKKIHNVCRKKVKNKKITLSIVRKTLDQNKYILYNIKFAGNCHSEESDGLKHFLLITECYTYLENKRESSTTEFSLPFPQRQSLTSDLVCLYSKWSRLIT